MKKELKHGISDIFRLGFIASYFNKNERHQKQRLKFAEFLRSGREAEYLKDLRDSLSSAQILQSEREIKRAEELGVEILTPVCAGYPKLLFDLEDPPLAIFVKGVFDDRAGIGIVGARRASSYGISIAETLAYEVGRAKISVISGLALGIDSAAHRGALRAAQDFGGYPGVAVLGSGLGKIYPIDNRNLANQLLDKGGAIISEYLVDEPPRAQNFPQRNRIISALSKRLLVVEAAERSGSLITAKLAIEQGRDVCAVPGPVGSLQSVGCNQLIRQGAELIFNAEQLLFGLADFNSTTTGVLRTKADGSNRTVAGNRDKSAPDPADLSPVEGSLSDFEKSIANFLWQHPGAESEEISISLGLSIRDLSVALTDLELREIIAPSAGGRWFLTKALQ